MDMIKKIVIVFLIICLLMDVGTSKQTTFNAMKSKYEKNNISSTWREEGLIEALIKKLRKNVPSSFYIVNGTKVIGSLTSLLSNDSDYLVVNSTRNFIDIIIEFSGVQNSGWLKINAFYLNPLPSQPLNVSAYNAITATFTYLGYANSSIFISNDYITADGRLIIKLWGRRNGTVCVSYAIFSEDPIRCLFPVYYGYFDSRLIHKVEVNVFSIPVKIYLLNISYFWRFLYAEPKIKWNFSERSFLAENIGTYKLYFEGLDTWNNPDYIQSKIVIIDKRGNYLPFDMFRVYYRYIKMRPNITKDILIYQRGILVETIQKRLILPVIELNLSHLNFNFFATKSNLSDIRFLQYLNNTVYRIPHFIKEWNGNYAIILIRPLLIDNSTKIILQYGNPNLNDISLTRFSSRTIIYDDSSRNKFEYLWILSDNLWQRVYDCTYGEYFFWHRRVENVSLMESIFKTWSDNITIEFCFKSNLTEYSNLANFGKNYLNISLVQKKNNISLNFVVKVLNLNTLNLSIVYRNETNSVVIYSRKVLLEDLLYKVLLRFNISLFAKRISVGVYQIDALNNTHNYLKESISNITLYYPQDIASFRISFYNLSLEVSKVHVLSNFNPEVLYGNVSSEKFSQDFSKSFIVEHTNYTQLYYPVFLSPRAAKVNILVKDIFNNTVFNSTFNSSDFYIVILDVCSWKFKNNRDDIFVHIELFPIENSSIKLSEWVAPGEIVKYLLRPSDYYLKITYQTGEVVIYNLSVRGDMFFLLNGTAIGDVIAHLEHINSTLVNMINEINIKIENLNSTIRNQTTIINLHIENLNASIHEFLLNIKSNISSINSTISELLVNISNNINNMESFLSEFNSTLTQMIISTNSSIYSVIIDISNRLAVINTSLGEFKQNISTVLMLMNSTLFNAMENICHILLASNATISKIIMDVSSQLVTINSTLGVIKILLNESIIFFSSNLSSFVNEVLSKIMATNSSITFFLNELYNILSMLNSSVYNVSWRIIDSIITVNTTLYSLLIDLNNEILAINSTFNSFLVNISSGIMLLNAQINLLNYTLLAVVYDSLFNITTAILVNLNETKNLAEAILSTVRVYEIRLYNSLTNELVSMDGLYRILVNGTLITGNILMTVAKCINVTLIDYWGRVLWSSIINKTLVIIRIPLGTLTIVNERDETIDVLISLNTSPQFYRLLIPPYTAEKVYLPINSTYHVVVKIAPNDTLANATITFLIENPVAILKISKRGVEEYQLLGKPGNENPNIVLYSFIYGVFGGLIISTLMMRLVKRIHKKRQLVSLEEMLHEILEGGDSKVHEIGEE